MKKNRNIEIFSLSFLDCVCCGFGALILLLVLSKTAEPIIFEEYSKDLDNYISKLQKELFELQGETHILNRDLVSKKEQVAEEQVKLARLQADLSTIKGRFSASTTCSQFS